MRRSVCPACELPIDTMASTCPHCYAALKPWSLNAPWVLPTLMGLLMLLLAVIAVDVFADLGMMKWVGQQVAPKDRRPLMERLR